MNDFYRNGLKITSLNNNFIKRYFTHTNVNTLNSSLATRCRRQKTSRTCVRVCVYSDEGKKIKQIRIQL